MTAPGSAPGASPRCSILTPVYEPPVDVLRETIASVLAQTVTDWQWVVVDDGSGPAVRSVLRQLAATERRVTLVERASNGGIVVASNEALAAATGEFLVLLDHDDVLDHRALAAIAHHAEQHDDLDYLYSDEAVIEADGSPGRAFYKPDWSPERLRSVNYCSHLSVLRRSLVDAVGGFREGFEGAQDHDLVLRVTERARRIVHVPHVLYHWRDVAGSVAVDRGAKPYAYEAGRRAVAEHLQRVGIEAEVAAGDRLGTYVVRRAVPDVLTTVIIPTNGAGGRVWGVQRTYAVDAIASVVAHTSRPIELVIVVDGGTPAGTVDAMRRAAGEVPIRFVDYDRPFNFSEKCNLGRVHADGDVLLFLNDDTEVISDEFLDPLLGLAVEEDVGAVGCLLLLADGRVQHAGHVYTGSTRHVFHGRGRDEEVPGDLLRIQRECVGVTAACMAVTARVFDDAGGFTPLLAGNFNDVDFCLKLRHLGYRNVWTPQAELYHFESATREPAASPEEWDVVVRRWGRQIADDPYWNANLEPQRDDWVERGLR